MHDLKVLWDHEISLTKLIFSFEIDLEVSIYTCIVSVSPSLCGLLNRLNFTDVEPRSHFMASCTDIDTKIHSTRHIVVDCTSTSEEPLEVRSLHRHL